VERSSPEAARTAARGPAASAAVAEGREVRVTGPVRRLRVAEVERELGIDLDAELELAFESRPVMMSGDVLVEGEAAP